MLLPALRLNCRLRKPAAAVVFHFWVVQQKWCQCYRHREVALRKTGAFEMVLDVHFGKRFVVLVVSRVVGWEEEERIVGWEEVEMIVG